MASYKQFYLPYVEQADVNYIYLLYLYCIAKRYNSSNFDPLHAREFIKSDIEFKSWKELEDKINTELCQYQEYKEQTSKTKKKKLISKDTLARMVKQKDYEDFIFFDDYHGYKTIILQNDFSELGYLSSFADNPEEKKKQFVRLTLPMINLLLEKKDNLLAKYLIYLLHYCGISKDGKTDFTANQFLSAIGYSINSNSIKDKIASYNKLLEYRGILTITRWTDEDKHKRNTYSIRY